MKTKFVQIAPDGAPWISYCEDGKLLSIRKMQLVTTMTPNFWCEF